jgi:thioredoxin 1
MLEVNDQNFEAEILQSDIPALIDFWAPWCGPCKMIAPLVEELAQQYAGKIKVAKLNVDVAPETATRYGVRGIPTVILFKDGQDKEKIVGAAPKARLEQMINKYL